MIKIITCIELPELSEQLSAKKMFYLVIIYFLMNSMKELLAEGAYRCFDKTRTPKHYKKK